MLSFPLSRQGIWSSVSVKQHCNAKKINEEIVQHRFLDIFRLKKKEKAKMTFKGGNSLVS